MKAKCLFVAIAALTIAGCSQNEVLETNPDIHRAIGFDVYTGVQTKGVETTTLSITTPGFGVMAVKGNSVYMAKRQVTSSDGGSTWTYQTPAYWPADGSTLSFYSYAPHGGSGITATSFDDDETPEIGFTIADSWADMIDLVAAKNENVASGTDVPVHLKHILTRIAFTAQLSEGISSSTGTTVHITSLKILQASSTKFYKSGTYNIRAETWSSTSAITGDYTIISSDTEINKNGTSTSLTGTDKYLFCIPVENLTAGEIQLEVTYKTTVNSVVSNKTVKFNVPATHFAQGAAYSYNFDISLNRISFSGEVDNTWTNGSGNLVEVP